jgi:serine/threonine protein kinase
MEKAGGLDLFEFIARERTFSVNAVRKILKKVLQALAHLHEHDGIHKDLKLENIVIDASGMGSVKKSTWSPKSVKLIDFDTVAEWKPMNPPSRDVLGTDQYISQEAYKGHYSPLSDVFAIGVVGYRMITGRFPFRGEIFNDQPGENWVGCPKMEEIRSKLKQQKVNFCDPVFYENPQMAELLSKMLHHDELRRPTAKQALEFEWMKSRPATSVVPNQDAGPLKAKKLGFGLLGSMEASCLPFLELKPHAFILPLISVFHTSMNV